MGMVFTVNFNQVDPLNRDFALPDPKGFLDQFEGYPPMLVGALVARLLIDKRFGIEYDTIYAHAPDRY